MIQQRDSKIFHPFIFLVPLLEGICRKASCGLWTGFRAAAGLLAAAGYTEMSAETSAPTSCLLFSTGWALIVRAGNKE